MLGLDPLAGGLREPWDGSVWSEHTCDESGVAQRCDAHKDKKLSM